MSDSQATRIRVDVDDVTSRSIEQQQRSSANAPNAPVVSQPNVQTMPPSGPPLPPPSQEAIRQNIQEQLVKYRAMRAQIDEERLASPLRFAPTTAAPLARIDHGQHGEFYYDAVPVTTGAPSARPPLNLWPTSTAPARPMGKPPSGKTKKPRRRTPAERNNNNNNNNHQQQQQRGGPSQAGRPPAIPGQPPTSQQQQPQAQAEIEDGDDVEEDESQYMYTYQAKKIRELFPDAAIHPDPLVETASLASVQLPDPTAGAADCHLHDEVAAGHISDAQLESIIYAFMKFNGPRLPDGKRRGFFLGDGAGVGKGRTIAGAIKQHWAAGGRYILWVSVSQDLRRDARRDLDDIEGQGIQIFEPKGTTHIPGFDFKGVVFVTYSLLANNLPPLKKNTKKRKVVKTSDGTEKDSEIQDEQEQAAAENEGNLISITNLSPKARLSQIIQWLTRGGDDGSLVIFDECHKAKNLLGENGSVGTQTARAVLHLQEVLPGAKILYSSATGASEPRNLAYMTRLWGTEETTATVKLLSGAKLGALELASMSLKATGSYLARTLSYAGAEFDLAQVEVSPVFAIMYRRATMFWVLLYRVMTAVFSESSGETGDEAFERKRKYWRGLYWAAHQRFFKSMLMSAKVSTTARLALEGVSQGMSVVIGLQSTGEAATDQQQKSDGEVFDDLVSAPQQILKLFIDNVFPVAHPNQPHLEAIGYLALLQHDVLFSMQKWKDMVPINELAVQQQQQHTGGGAASAAAGNTAPPLAPVEDAETAAGLIGSNIRMERIITEEEQIRLAQALQEEEAAEEVNQAGPSSAPGGVPGRQRQQQVQQQQKVAELREQRQHAADRVTEAKRYRERVNFHLISAVQKQEQQRPVEVVDLSVEEEDIVMGDVKQPPPPRPPPSASVAVQQRASIISAPMVGKPPSSTFPQENDPGNGNARRRPSAPIFVDLTLSSDDEEEEKQQQKQFFTPAQNVMEFTTTTTTTTAITNTSAAVAAAAAAVVKQESGCKLCFRPTDVAMTTCMSCNGKVHAACLNEYRIRKDWTCDTCKYNLHDDVVDAPSTAAVPFIKPEPSFATGGGGVRVKTEPAARMPIKTERAAPFFGVVVEEEEDALVELSDTQLADKTVAQLRSQLSSADERVASAQLEVAHIDAEIAACVNTNTNNQQQQQRYSDGAATANTNTNTAALGAARAAAAAAAARAANQGICSPVKQPESRRTFLNASTAADVPNHRLCVTSHPDAMDAVPDAHGDTEMPLADDNLAYFVPGYSPELARIKGWLLAILRGGLQLPANPLDDLISLMGGPSQVAELTGRKGGVERDQDSGLATYKKRSNADDGPAKEVNLREKRSFMDGRKKIAIISDAASTGISLQADKRCGSANRRRLHLTLELPWSADRAIQQFGRSHRANQQTAPKYTILVTPCGGEYRFASAAAKRLQSLGALLRGDRNAVGAGAELKAFDIDTVPGNEALGRVMQCMVNRSDEMLPSVPWPTLPPELTPPPLHHEDEDEQGGGGTATAAAVLQTLDSPFFVHFRARLCELGLLDPDGEGGYVLHGGSRYGACKLPIAKFLNRMLGLPINEQDLLFKFFSDMMDATTARLRSEGKLDTGIQTINGRSISVVDRRIITRDEASGATVERVDIHADQGTSYEEATQMLEDSKERLAAIVGERQQLSGFYVCRSFAGRKLLGTSRQYIMLCTEVVDQAAVGAHVGSIRMKITRPYGTDYTKIMSMREINIKQYRFEPNLGAAKELWDAWFNFTATNCMCGDNCRAEACRIGLRFKTISLLCGAILPVWPRLEMLHNVGSFAITKRRGESSTVVEPLQIRRATTKTPGDGEANGEPIVGIAAVCAEEMDYFVNNITVAPEGQRQNDVLQRAHGTDYYDPNSVRGLAGGSDPFARPTKQPKYFV